MAEQRLLFEGTQVITNIPELQSWDRSPGVIIKETGNGFYKIKFPTCYRNIHFKGLDIW
jgi:hypothetical protein|tara:strand:+ start:583 stop:759 length:177 start_codon:yes stop_codon:yes gene_type:complete